MQTTKLSKPRAVAVYSGRERGAAATMPESEFSDGVLRDTFNGVTRELAVSEVALRGVCFRTDKPLSPGTIKHLTARGEGSSLASALRVVSCRPRGDGKYDVTAEFF